MTRYRLLIISESDSIHNVIKLILADEPYVITSVYGVKDGLERFKETSCDIILIDDNLSVISAYKSCLEIKKQEKIRNIPILLMYSEGNTFDINNITIRDSMVNGLIKKPLEMDLIRKLKEVLSVKRNDSNKLLTSKEVKSILNNIQDNNVIFMGNHSKLYSKPINNLPVDDLDELLIGVHAQFKNCIKVESLDISRINKSANPILNKSKSSCVEKQWMQPISNYLNNTEVCIEVDLNVDDITIYDIIKLQVGDIIPLNKSYMNDLNIKIEGVTKFKACCEIDGDFSKIKITTSLIKDVEMLGYREEANTSISIKNYIQKNRYRRLQRRKKIFSQK